MTARMEIQAAKESRDRWAARARAAGHDLRWALGPEATRKGHAYFWVGTCTRCAAEVSVGATWSSCGVLRDARTTYCPGTADLSDAETAQQQAITAAIISFEQTMLQITAEGSSISVDGGAR